MFRICIYKGWGMYDKDGLILYRLLTKYVSSQKYSVSFVTPEEIISGALTSQTSLIVIGGGFDLGLIKVLGHEGISRIKEYVQNGGSYLGICSGAYFASDYIEFDKDGPLEVTGKRFLKFYPGHSYGPIYKPYDYKTRSGAVASNITYCPECTNQENEGKAVIGQLDEVNVRETLIGQQFGPVKDQENEGKAVIGQLYEENVTETLIGQQLGPSDKYSECLNEGNVRKSSIDKNVNGMRCENTNAEIGQDFVNSVSKCPLSMNLFEKLKVSTSFISYFNGGGLFVPKDDHLSVVGGEIVKLDVGHKTKRDDQMRENQNISTHDYEESDNILLSHDNIKQHNGECIAKMQGVKSISAQYDKETLDKEYLKNIQQHNGVSNYHVEGVRIISSQDNKKSHYNLESPESIQQHKAASSDNNMASLGYDNVSVLAIYSDLDTNPAAIVKCRVGEGTAVLSHVHFEFDAEDINDGDVLVSDIVDKLKTSEMNRRCLFLSILQELNIEIEESQLALLGTKAVALQEFLVLMSKTAYERRNWLNKNWDNKDARSTDKEQSEQNGANRRKSS